MAKFFSGRYVSRVEHQDIVVLLPEARSRASL
jgi:hypothetical protein